MMRRNSRPLLCPICRQSYDTGSPFVTNFSLQSALTALKSNLKPKFCTSTDALIKNPSLSHSSSLYDFAQIPLTSRLSSRTKAFSLKNVIDNRHLTLDPLITVFSARSCLYNSNPKEISFGLTITDSLDAYYDALFSKTVSLKQEALGVIIGGRNSTAYPKLVCVLFDKQLQVLSVGKSVRNSIKQCCSPLALAITYDFTDLDEPVSPILCCSSTSQVSSIFLTFSQTLISLYPSLEPLNIREKEAPRQVDIQFSKSPHYIIKALEDFEVEFAASSNDYLYVYGNNQIRKYDIQLNLVASLNLHETIEQFGCSKSCIVFISRGRVYTIDYNQNIVRFRFMLSLNSSKVTLRCSDSCNVVAVYSEENIVLLCLFNGGEVGSRIYKCTKEQDVSTSNPLVIGNNCQVLFMFTSEGKRRVVTHEIPLSQFS
ncbi:hypothetical protein RCL1_005986 [Eukaryota sp. TZLM3-RCL]